MRIVLVILAFSKNFSFCGPCGSLSLHNCTSVLVFLQFHALINNKPWMDLHLLQLILYLTLVFFRKQQRSLLVFNNCESLHSSNYKQPVLKLCFFISPKQPFDESMKATRSLPALLILSVDCGIFLCTTISN